MKTSSSKVIPADQLEEAAKLKEIFEDRQEAAKNKGKRLSQLEVGEACGWASAQSIMSQLMTGKMRLGLEALVKLCHVLKFSPEEVSPRLAETISMIAKLNAQRLLEVDDLPETYRLAVTTGCVPVRLQASVSSTGAFVGIAPEVGDHHGLLRVHSKDKEAFAVMIFGNALAPRIRAHEFIVVEPGSTPQSGDDVLVTLKDGSQLLAEFIYHRDGLYRLDSLRPGVDPAFLDESLVASVSYIDAIVKKTRFEPS